MWEWLPARSGELVNPGRPLILAAWDPTSPEQKRERFLAHLRYADATYMLDEIDEYLRSLPESEWFHHGVETERKITREPTMSRFALNNKLATKAQFALRECPGFDRVGDSGITPIPAVFESRIGTEVALAVIVKNAYIRRLAKVRPFDFRLTTGLAATSHGPVAFLLFYVRNAADPTNPYFAHDYQLNPFDSGAMAVWRDLARQSHWHVVLVDAQQQVEDVFEFENVFELGEALDTFSEAVRGLHTSDFARAQKEFWEQYSIDDLLNLRREYL